MAKYNHEQKLEAVLNVTEKGLTYGAASKIMGINHDSIQKWVKMYEKHGIEGLSIKRGVYDGQFKVNVIEYMHTNHISVREAAVKFGVPSYTTVWEWERIYYEEGRDALFRDNRGRKKMSKESKPREQKLDRQTEEDLIAECQRLRMENAYLKKLNTLVQKRVQRKNGKK